MKIPESGYNYVNNKNNINNINNINLPNPIQTVDTSISRHILKDSTLPIIQQIKGQEQKNEEEVNTIMTNVQFIEDKKDMKEEPIYELNKSAEKTDDSSKNSEEPKDTNQQNESFLQKTKRWAGNVWSYVNVANYFPKAEFKEYRNANGDWVKIPVKKIPLKKKKAELTDEEYIVSKTLDRERGNLSLLTGEKIPIPNLY